MARMLPLEGLVKNLNRDFEPGDREYVPSDKAYELLKGWTGQDFGDDVEAWRKWIAENSDTLLSKLKKHVQNQKE